MRDFPPGSDDPDGPYSWAEQQDFIERPRMRRETDTEYDARRSLASTSRAILASLRSIVQRWDY